jgi:hypothetical protein
MNRITTAPSTSRTGESSRRVGANARSAPTATRSDAPEILTRAKMQVLDPRRTGRSADSTCSVLVSVVVVEPGLLSWVSCQGENHTGDKDAEERGAAAADPGDSQGCVAAPITACCSRNSAGIASRCWPA